MQSPFHEEAPHWAPSWNVLAEVGKRPIETGWPRWCYERQPAGYVGGYTRSGTHYNIGLPLGQRGLVAIDIDTDDPAHIARIIACLPPITAATQTVIPPSIHPDTGEAYVWIDPQGLET